MTHLEKKLKARSFVMLDENFLLNRNSTLRLQKRILPGCEPAVEGGR